MAKNEPFIEQSLKKDCLSLKATPRMPTHTFYGYAPDTITIDPNTGDAVLAPGYNASQDRVRFEVTDNDNFADGDESNDEVGDDANQTAYIYNSDGSLAHAGQFYVEEVRWYETAGGDSFSVTVFEMDGEVIGFIPSEPMTPGESYTYTGSSEAGEKIGGKNNNASRNNYTTYETSSVACFGPGTMIATDNGEIPVEWLETSDRVLTRDHGYQPILWIGRTKLPAEYFQAHPNEAPVCLPAGALGSGCPTHDLHLTGDHRVLVHSAIAELIFFSSEVLAPAKAWVEAGRAQAVIPSRSFTVTHILCADHQIIAAEGAWVESMFTGVETLRRLHGRDRLHLEQLFDGNTTQMQTARPCLSKKEAVFLLRHSSRDRNLAEIPQKLRA